MLSLRRVAKRFEGTAALRGVDLEVTAGETVVLIGPSGCGKSTLLRLMIGLIAPDEGTVAFGGEVLERAKLSLLRRRMGYVIQSGGLFPHLTARANAALQARHLGRERPWIERRIDELAELTHLPREVLGRYPLELSGGQRQRVSLMRALMLDPDVLLLDEPLGALDPMIRADLQRDLREIFRRLAKTVVLVTHDLAEASYFSRRMVLLDRGRVVQQGSYRELLESPADDFVRRFIQAQRHAEEG
ncbi:MAG: ATP-binding cassette domain-containing protein [Acidobacteriota bacterium]|nr:ATP-binding cassette domain-containing protein [Acidobacteriota bacterium]MDH3522512.1 ATP-binding cassette domain-containing protein [Acidobacteriota bacterium]